MNRRNARRGFALFLSLLLLLVLTVSAVALMFNTSVESTLAGTETKVSRTFYAADSGIEYAGANLLSAVGWKGGTLPRGLSANIPGTTPTQDITVTVTPPVFLGYSVHPGDELQAQGSGYGSNQTVENIYAVNSTATSTTIQSQKTISAQIGVYPAQLGLP